MYNKMYRVLIYFMQKNLLMQFETMKKSSIGCVRFNLSPLELNHFSLKDVQWCTQAATKTNLNIVQLLLLCFSVRLMQIRVRFALYTPSSEEFFKRIAVNIATKIFLIVQPSYHYNLAFNERPLH
jgi:hypothetical protein